MVRYLKLGEMTYEEMGLVSAVFAGVMIGSWKQLK